MVGKKALDIITKLQATLKKDGFAIKSLVEDLKELRPYFIETKDPTITKVVRLSYEHLEKYNTFNLSIPAEEVLDEEGNVVEQEYIAPASEEERVESFDYLLSLFINGKNKTNRADIIQYRDRLIESLA